jgi:hypothetical protein
MNGLIDWERLMRKKNLLSIIVLLTFILNGCENELFDFRNKYLGNWEFDVSNRHEVYNVTQGFHDTTTSVKYHGVIEYGSKHSAILFQASGYSKEFSIEKDGKIIPENDYGPNYSESGGFEGSNIFKYNYYHHWGATRQYVAIDIEGVKE